MSDCGDCDCCCGDVGVDNISCCDCGAATEDNVCCDCGGDVTEDNANSSCIGCCKSSSNEAGDNSETAAS